MHAQRPGIDSLPFEEGGVMGRIRTAVSAATVLACVVLAAAGVVGAAPVPNVDVSQRHLNESEEAIAVNPTNPNNIVIVTNVGHREAGLTAGMFEGVSFDGGATWATKLIGNNAAPPKSSGKKDSGDNRGLFRFVDQPTITAARGEVWVVFNAGGPLFATGAPVTGFGKVGSFFQGEVVPGTNNCTYGDVAIGPAGQVMQVCTLTESGQGGGKLFVNVDPDGLGPASFGDRVFVAETHVGGFDFIPAQIDRSIDAEPGLAWDRTGGRHNGRVYLVYTKEQQNESDNTDIYVRYSDNNGTSWSPEVRVNDDRTANSQFLPKISLDQTSGNIATVWYDARLDLGSGGPGDTDGVPNTDAQFWGAFSKDGGVSFSPNMQVSAGTSNSHDSGNGIDFGDYSGLSFFGGMAHPAWSDNSNSTGTNPDGELHQLDIYTAALPVT